MTLKEYLIDYASPATRALGEKMIQQQIGEIPKEKVQQIVRERLVKLNRETGISASRKMDQTDNTEERRYRRDRKKEDLLMGMNATPASERVHIGSSAAAMRGNPV